MKNKK